MRKVYASDNTIILGHVRQVLEDHAIGCIVRNDFLLGASGEIPVNETWPEIWITDDRDFERAHALGRCGRVGDERTRSTVGLRMRRVGGGPVYRLLAVWRLAPGVRRLTVPA